MTDCANLLESSKYSFDVWMFSLTHHDLPYGWLDKAYILQQYNSFLQHTNKHTCNVVQFCSTKKQLLKYECCTLQYNGCISSKTWNIFKKMCRFFIPSLFNSEWRRGISQIMKWEEYGNKCFCNVLQSARSKAGSGYKYEMPQSGRLNGHMTNQNMSANDCQALLG